MRRRYLFSVIFFIVLAKPQPGLSSTPKPFVQTGHTGNVYSVAFSPDGKYAISGSHDQTIRLWDIRTGRELRIFKRHKGSVSSVTFSPNGRYALSGSEDKTIRLWDIATGKEVKVFKGHKSGVYSVAFSPDGSYILSGGEDRTLRLWDIKTGRKVRSFNGFFKGHSDRVYSVAFSPDGRYALSGSEDKTVRLWEVKSGKELRVLKGHTSSVRSVAFSPDGRYVLSVDSKLHLWDVDNGREVRAFEGNLYYARSAAFSPDGRYVISGGWLGPTLLWDLNTGRAVRIFKGHKNGAGSVAFSPDSRYVLSGGYDATLRLWDVDTGKQLRIFKGYKSGARFVAFNPNGRSALSAEGDELRLWDMTTGRQMRIFKGHTGIIYSVAFNQDGRYAISGSSDKTVRLWDVTTGEQMRVFKGHTRYVHCVAFNQDGRYVISGSFDKTVRLWDVNSGRELKIFKHEGHLEKGMLSSIALSPDGRYVLSGMWDGTLRLWDVTSGRQVRVLKGHRGHVHINSVAFSPNGRYALSGGSDATRLWEVSTGKTVRVFNRGNKWINNVAFSNDGKHVLVAGEDLHVWEVATGRQTKDIGGKKGSSFYLPFSPDGRNALAVGYDGSLQLWSLASGKELANFYRFEDGEWIVITSEGYFNASSNGAKYVNVRVGPMDVLSIDQFFEQFFNPILVAQVLKGRKVEFKRDIAKGIIPPPEVRIISPKPGQTFTEDTIQVEVLARDMGGGIDEIRLFHNGKVIGEEQRGIQIIGETREVKRVYQISLLQGENCLHAVAFNRDRTESNPYELVVLLKAPSKETTLNLLVVGINAYRNPALNLNYAEPDARGIVEFFSKRGSGLFRKIRVMELYNEKATGASIRSRLKGLVDTEPQDAVVIFLAGHGENLKSKWYFIPYEVTYPERDQEVMTKGISSDDIAGYVRNMGARKILMLMDSCKAGAALLAFRGYEDRRALMQLARATGVHIVAASTKDQYAVEVKTLGHGVFTHTLLAGIKGAAAAGGQKTITVRRLLAFVEERLPEVSKKYKQEAQYPVVYSRGMDFPLSIK